VYMPLYSFVGVIGLFLGAWNYRRLEKIWKKGGRAW
jgi:hypothetical protein